MADEVKPKRPVPSQFLKKKKEIVKLDHLPDPPAEIIVLEANSLPESPKQIDFDALVKDLMFNKYFQIMEKEARPIARKMIDEGFEKLRDVKWFLSQSERIQLAKELKDKHVL